MHHFWEKVEKINGKLIPPALVLLLGIIIFELFVHTENLTVELIIKIADYVIISIFVVDLTFLAVKARGVKFFFKNYWLDVIAVFPFVLFSRVVSFFAESGFTIGQAIFHESVEVSKIATKAERFTKIGRGLKLGARMVRLVTKTVPRFSRVKLKHVRA